MNDATSPNRSQRKVLLIGWDAADWKVIAPLLDEGKMPHLESLINRGVMGNLATLYPILSPMLWTSIATGKRAWKHGIYGFSEPDAQTGHIRPISNLGRKCKAVWNILNQNGFRSNVVGWWPSHPAEPINGVMVSELFKSPRNKPEPWPLPPGAIHPERLREPLKPMRIHPHELDGEQLLPFVPLAGKIDQEEDKRLLSLAKCLAECSSIHAASTAIMQLEPWDFMAVYYDAIDHFSHGFMRYHPPRLDWVDARDFELYKDVVTSAYRYHDMMLGTLLHLAGDETTVILMSDHGFHSDHLRPKTLPHEPAGPAEEHRPLGILVMAGPGIKQDELIFGASLLDIVPTILSLFDLPTGRDMDGATLVGAFEQPPEPQFIESWEGIPGDDGQHPAHKRLDPVEGHESIQHLIDLGYIEQPHEDKQLAVARTKRELQYNLARAYQGAGLAHEALPIFEELWQQSPDEHRFGVRVFHCLLKLGRVEESGRTLSRIRESKQAIAKRASEELRAIEQKLREEEKKAADLPQPELAQLRELRWQASTNQHTLHYMQGLLYQAEGKLELALVELKKAESVQVHNRPDLYRAMGNVCLRLRRWKQAQREFQRMLELDPTNPAARLGLARCLAPRRKYEESLAEATAAVGLMYHQPEAHYLAGTALMQLERYPEAADALLVAVNQNSVFPQAHRRLAQLYGGPLHDPDKAASYRKLQEQSREHIVQVRAQRQVPREAKPGNAHVSAAVSGTASLRSCEGVGVADAPMDAETVVIVAGLPRSGTSMMMQMLAAGGLPVLVDDKREADESNPRGYYEFEAAKRLSSDRSWLSQAAGKAVKIVVQLLPQLPMGHQYRIVFMERSLDEIIASQQKLLQRTGKAGGRLSPEQLAETYMKQVELVKQQLDQVRDRVSVLSVSYADTVLNPAKTAAEVNRFLGGCLDEASMARVVERDLRHEVGPDEQ